MTLDGVFSSKAYRSLHPKMRTTGMMVEGYTRFHLSELCYHGLRWNVQARPEGEEGFGQDHDTGKQQQTPIESYPVAMDHHSALFWRRGLGELTYSKHWQPARGVQGWRGKWAGVARPRFFGWVIISFGLPRDTFSSHARVLQGKGERRLGMLLVG